MRVIAPGKLLLTGAYAVLEGAPALVVALDRYAVADLAARGGAPSAEVAFAWGAHVADAPAVDASALFDGETKLGLGSSAAVLVASLGARALAAGADLADAKVRADLFGAARHAHASVQSGGSGVDVAASVYGGALRYALSGTGAPAERRAEVIPVSLPQGLSMVIFWTGVSARTSDLRARVDALRARDAKLYGARLASLADAAVRAASAVDEGDARAFVLAAREHELALRALGRAADVPLVAPAYADLADLATAEQAAFFLSGAGGGDVAVFLGASAPSKAFLDAASAASVQPIDTHMDRGGVRLDDRLP